MDWPQLKTFRCQSDRKEVPGEELVWIEDKILQFTIPDLPPRNYTVTIHDDKGPPGDTVYSVLETTAYVIFPPVWPFVFRSNQAQLIYACCRAVNLVVTRMYVPARFLSLNFMDK